MPYSMNMNVLNPEYDPQLNDILELDNNELQGWPCLAFNRILFILHGDQKELFYE